MIYHEEVDNESFSSKGLVRRIFTYIRPYWHLVLGSIIMLVITTGGQLALPVLIQRTVDENLRPSWVRTRVSLESEIVAWDARLEGEGIVFGNYIYYTENQAGRFLRGRAAGAGQTGEAGARADNGRSRADFDLYFLIQGEGILNTLLSDPGFDPYISLIEASAASTGSSSDSPADAGAEYIVISEDNYSEIPQEYKEILRIQDWRGIQQKTLSYILILAAVLVFNFLQLFLMSLAGQNVMKDLRLQLYSRTSRQSLRFLQSQQVGRLVTRVTNDVETINEFFTNVLSAVVADVVMMVGVIVTLLVLNPQLGLVSLVILPPVSILLVVYQKKARLAYGRVRNWVSAVNAYLAEHFSGVAVVQAFVREQRTRNEFSDRNNNLYKANLRELTVFAVFRPIVDLLATCSIALLIYAGSSFLLQGIVSLGVLIAFINLIERFYQPVQDMAEKFTLVQSALAGSERVFDLLDKNFVEDDVIEETAGAGMRHASAASGGEPKNSTSGSEPKNIKGAIAFNNVQFSYIRGEEVLRGISFSCDPGERIALVGHTGSGKTTIANVITRLWNIDSGQITIDGIDVQQIPTQELRRIVQIIQQDVSLFHLSLRENLLLGKDMSDEEIYSVLADVEAADFVRALPNGLDTRVAENTSNFSTGQIQLLSFARLLIQNPRIVIMDEATASIDTETEHKVQIAIDRILRGRTSIVIAHRLSTIKNADRILVLNKGQVAESGNHEELMKAGGLYSALQTIQSS